MKIEFFEILAIFGELLFLGAIFRPEGVKLAISRSTTVKDNSLSFPNIGRNLKFDHGKALKNGDKVSHVLELKCDFWDICDIWIHLLGKLC